MRVADGFPDAVDESAPRILEPSTDRGRGAWVVLDCIISTNSRVTHDAAHFQNLLKNIVRPQPQGGTLFDQHVREGICELMIKVPSYSTEGGAS